jgi:hypothetical protein
LFGGFSAHIVCFTVPPPAAATSDFAAATEEEQEDIESIKDEEEEDFERLSRNPTLVVKSKRSAKLRWLKFLRRLLSSPPAQTLSRL